MTITRNTVDVLRNLIAEDADEFFECLNATLMEYNFEVQQSQGKTVFHNLNSGRDFEITIDHRPAPPQPAPPQPAPPQPAPPQPQQEMQLMVPTTSEQQQQYSGHNNK